MIALGMAGIVVGFALGLRFTAFVLLPVELAALVVAIAVSILGPVGWGAALLGFLSFCLTSQVSYAVMIALPVMFRGQVRDVGLHFD